MADKLRSCQSSVKISLAVHRLLLEDASEGKMVLVSGFWIEAGLMDTPDEARRILRSVVTGITHIN